MATPNQGSEAMFTSAEKHLANTHDLIASAEKFVSTPGISDDLAASAESFISSAESHASGVQQMMSGAEDHISSIHTFLGAEKPPKKGGKGGAEDEIKPSKKDDHSTH